MLTRPPPRFPDLSKILDPASIQVPKLDDDPAYRAAMADLAAHEKRRDAAYLRRDMAEFRRRGRPHRMTILERGKALVAGASIPAIDPAAEMDAADQEIEALNKAIGLKLDALAEIKGRIEREAAERFVELNRHAHEAAFAAAEVLAQAYGAIHAIHARLLAAGLTPRHDVLPSFQLGGQLAIGNADNCHSQLFKMRTWMREKLKD